MKLICPDFHVSTKVKTLIFMEARAVFITQATYKIGSNTLSPTVIVDTDMSIDTRHFIMFPRFRLNLGIGST